MIPKLYKTLYRPRDAVCAPDACSLMSSSLMSLDTSALALLTANSLVDSIARYNFLSPSGGVFPGAMYVPLTVKPASEYSEI